MSPLLPIAARQPEDSVEQCKIKLRDMVHSLKAKIGSVRATGRYHQQGLRKLEHDYSVKKEVLGAGINGGVRLAFGQNSRKGDRFAVKTLNLKEVVETSSCDALLAELEIHMTVDHPHIVQLVDIYEAPAEVHMVMECMDGGELFDRMIQKKIFSNDEAADTIRQILLTVAYLHDNDIVHRDLKPENFLFDEAGSSHVKLTDFGFSTHWKDGDDSLRRACGTLGYVAPEVLDKAYTKQCDLWSVGVIAFALLAGYLPFEGPKPRMIENIKACNYRMFVERWGLVRDTARSFVQALLQADPHQRLTARSALEHPWIAEMQHEPQLPDIRDSIFVGLRNFQQASQLQRACCSVASLSATSGLVGTQLRTVFLKMDKRGTGTVQLEDFKEVLSDKSRKAEDDELLENLFAALNKDEAGCLHYSDFLAAMELATGQLSQSSIGEAFRRFDIDNSGYVTKNNIQELLGSSSEDEAVQQLLEDISLAHPSRRISYSAFEARLSKLPESMPANSTTHGQEAVVKKQQRPQHIMSWLSQVKKILVTTSKISLKLTVHPATLGMEYSDMAY